MALAHPEYQVIWVLFNTSEYYCFLYANFQVHSKSFSNQSLNETHANRGVTTTYWAFFC